MEHRNFNSFCPRATVLGAQRSLRLEHRAAGGHRRRIASVPFYFVVGPRTHRSLTLTDYRTIHCPVFSVCSAGTDDLFVFHFVVPFRIYPDFVLPIDSHLQDVQRPRVSPAMVPAFSSCYCRNVGTLGHLALPRTFDLQATC